jgi:hypothetical protein
MNLIPLKKVSLKSAFCICANNWVCHFCTGERVNLVSAYGTRCPTAQVRVFKDSLHPHLQHLRSMSPDRSISRTNKYLPFKCGFCFVFCSVEDASVMFTFWTGSVAAQIMEKSRND